MNPRSRAVHENKFINYEIDSLENKLPKLLKVSERDRLVEDPSMAVVTCNELIGEENVSGKALIATGNSKEQNDLESNVVLVAVGKDLVPDYNRVAFRIIVLSSDCVHVNAVQQKLVVYFLDLSVEKIDGWVVQDFQDCEKRGEAENYSLDLANHDFVIKDFIYLHLCLTLQPFGTAIQLPEPTTGIKIDSSSVVVIITEAIFEED